MTTRTSPTASAPLTVLQITDPHLLAETTGELLGINTRESLGAVTDLVLAHEAAPDLLLATGDLSQDGSESAYRAVAEILGRIPGPSVWMPGNHDHRETLYRLAAEYRSGQRHVRLGAWQFIQLDSSVPGQTHGQLQPGEIALLDSALTAEPERPAVVSLHHHPVDVGSDWMNAIGLKNRDEFWAVIDRHPQVRAVVWGHVHQEVDQQRNGVRLLATPSTCVQFESGSREFSVEEKAPGYRWLTLYPDGTLDTGVRRALDFNFSIDTTSTGY